MRYAFPTMPESVDISPFRPVFDDQQGDVSSSPTGATQWNVAQIGTTGFFIPWLQAGQNDFFQIRIQFSHRKAVGRPLPSVHAHAILSVAPTAGQTVILDWAYCLVPVGQAVPALASWTSGTHTETFTGTEAANSHRVVILTPEIAMPATETSSTLLLFKCSRKSQGVGADTYPGDLGILYIDPHLPVGRHGSVLEY